MNQKSTKPAQKHTQQNGRLIEARARHASAWTELNSWEREVFFQPSLVERERLAARPSRASAMLLALFLGLAAGSAALANDALVSESSSTDESSESSSIYAWLLDLFTISQEEEAFTASAKNENEADPAEGEP